MILKDVGVMYGNPGEAWNYPSRIEQELQDNEDTESIPKNKPNNFFIYAGFLRTAIDLGVPKDISRIPGARLSKKLILPEDAGMFAGDKGGLIYLRQNRNDCSRYSRNNKPSDTFVWAPGENNYLLIAALHAYPIYVGESVFRNSRQALDDFVRTIDQETFDLIIKEDAYIRKCPKMQTRVNNLKKLILEF